MAQTQDSPKRSTTASERRGGRGDRAGRYGHVPEVHNLRDLHDCMGQIPGDVEEFGEFQPDLSISSKQDVETSQNPNMDNDDNELFNHTTKRMLYPAAKQCAGDWISVRDDKRKSILGAVDEFCTSLEELRDQDCCTEHDSDEKPSHIIMLRMLPFDVTTVEILAQLQQQGIQPKDIRLMRKTSGQSRGFAFVEFNLIQEATSWMETNQGVLSLLGQRVSMHYSDPKPRAREDWLCNKCGVQNFKRRAKCFKCCTNKAEAELKLPHLTQDMVVGPNNNQIQGLLPSPVHYSTSGLCVAPGQSAQPQTDVANDTLILRNVGLHTSVDAILLALSPFATLLPSNVRLIKDKHTNLNRGFAFLQLSTIVEASQLLQILQTQLPSLSIDGKAIMVEFAKGSKRDVFLTESGKVSSATVASTAIAAAQWAVTQNALGANSSGVVFQQAAPVTYTHETFPGSINATGVGDVSTEAHREPTIGAMTPEGAIPQPLIHTQTISTSAATAPSIQDELMGTTVPVQPAIPGTEHELQQYPVPNMSTYQYDESSGYYYDPLTGLYYDPNSQYYYNPHTQHYMYWDGEKHKYIPAESQSNIDNVGMVSKDKKEKEKGKTAQQIAKDMERWAKSLNKHKENMRSSSGGSVLGLGQTRGRSEDLRESASADAGYAVLEKKGALLERPQINFDQLRQTTMSSPILQLGLVAVYNGDADKDEGASEDQGEVCMTDWSKLACLLCRRQFPSKEALIRHQELSELHKQNLEQMQFMLVKGKITDEFQPPDWKKRKILSM
ncbi:unnamed protein product [Knipowitschia caucasica]|uniref:RNA-binding protein 10 n=1 Tax=Knipowitschia caucasica TaxID=637954 RepID=A0AAV2LYX4_KNICA